MHTRAKANSTSAVSHSEKRYYKRIYFNRKSCAAMFMSAALLLTSVDCIKVSAEELTDQVPPTGTEVMPENQESVSGNTTTGEGDVKEPDYVRTEAGAVVIRSFVPLSEEKSRIKLDETEEKGERLSLEEVTKLMPETLQAKAAVNVPADSDAETGEKPGEGESQPPTEDKKPEEGGGETQPPTEGEQPGEGDGETQPPVEGEQPGEGGGETQPPTEGEQPGEGGGETQPPTEGEQPGEGGGETQPPTEGEQPGEGGGETQPPTEGEQPGEGGEESQPPTEENPPETGEEQTQTPQDGNQSGESGEQSGAAEGQSVPEEQPEMNDTAMAEPDRISAAADSREWRFLVAVEDDSEVLEENGGGESGDSQGGDDDRQETVGAGDGTTEGENGGQGEAGGGDGTTGGENSGQGEAGDGDGAAEGGNGGQGDTGEAAGGENGGQEDIGATGGAAESGDGNTGDSAGGNGSDGSQDNAGATDGAAGDTGSSGNGEAAGGTGTKNDTAAGEENAVPTKEVDVEIPVQWVCDDDYENTELTEYTFRPTWDTNAWFYEDVDSVSTILVSCAGQEIAEEVSTEEELAAAFAAGLKKVTLKADIALTKTLTLPADAEIELDGQGHSLLRGTDELNENGIFIGTMIALDGEGYTEDTYGALTIKNITVDGTAKADRAGAPVILDCGDLTLEEDAVVKDNFNYGTYPKEEDGETETILDYGGGIQVQKDGCLTLTEKSSVTENFADEFGGGVYLADGATLYLYADVIRENNVSDDAGHGADLYAAGGSTIYYDASVDMEREEFYLCEGVTLICLQGAEVAADETDRNDPNVEIYISSSDDNGYDDPFLEKLKTKLEAEPYHYSVIPKSVEVDTTDLSDWYVYDHYDEDAWKNDTEIEGSTAKEKWEKIHGDDEKREYYPCKTTHYWKPAVEVDNIAAWLDNDAYKDSDNVYRLAKFKEHIDNQGTNMTFVGYDYAAYVDFMFYQPQLAEDKVVDFDIDSSRVVSHALSGVGFLMNAGVDAEGKKLYGYLIYYHYGKVITTMGDTPTYRYVCKLNGVDVAGFHGGKIDLKKFFGVGTMGAITEANKNTLKDTYKIEVIDSSPISSDKWKSQMSIRIQASDTKLTIRQQDKSAEIVTEKTVPVENIGYNGFGPLVAYTSQYHTGCSRASCFTYSNISMRYTKVTQGGGNVLQPLERADYTQEGTQKYFLNLFGTTADMGYDTTGVEVERYQRFLKLMQVEGVALITDRKTPFEEYLGKSGEAGSNLFEISEKAPDKPLSVDELAEKIAEYISKQTTTYIRDKVSPDGDGKDMLKEAAPSQAVGNIWIESTDGEQIRELWGDDISGDGYEIRIRDDITYYLEDKDKYTVTYEVQKPHGGNAYEGSDHSFSVKKDASKWPAGRYTVKQTITLSGDGIESEVHGYAYFDLRRTAEGHTHTFGDFEIIQEPTCTEPGRRIRTCSGCGKTEEETIPATGHSLKGEWSMDETDHWHVCTVCGEKLDVAAHTWGEYETDQEASCTTPGHRIRRCTICGKTQEESNAATGHSLKDEWSMDEIEHWHECEVCKERFDIAVHIWSEYEIVQEATCTEDGSRRRKCTVCGKTQEETIPATGHSLKDEWSMDETEHWHVCEICNEKFDAAAHTWGAYEIRQEATCTKDGLKTRTCGICGAVQEETIPATGHRFRERWSMNTLEHWHECEICNAKTDVGFHRFGDWVTDEEAAEDKDGSRHRSCLDCGYKEVGSVIRGKVTKREDCGENAPKTAITTELPALALATLAEEDVHAVGNGTDIEIVLVVVDADNTVSAADREAVVSTAGAYKLGQYFDITLYKEMENSRSQVEKTGDEIRLTIEIPENIRKAKRSYAVARVHNGTADILQDLDSADTTVTIDTDRFSTYAFVYAEPAKKFENGSSPNPGGKEKKVSYPVQEQTAVEVNYQSPKEETIESPKEAAPESQRDSEPKTGQPIRFELYATIAFVEGASYLFFLFADSRGMSEETKTELVSRMIRWAKRGGKLRRLLALAAIFVLLVYYHSIGKQVRVRWMHLSSSQAGVE